MSKYFLSAMLFTCVLCSRVFADSAYEFSWAMQNLNYEVLVIVSDDSDIAVGKVRMTYKNGDLFGFVNENFHVKVVSDGIIFYGFGTPWDYTPDNFLLHESGKAFNLDDAGNLSPLWIRQVYRSDMNWMIQKYHIR